MAHSSGTPTALSGRLVTDAGIIEDGVLRWDGTRILEVGTVEGDAAAERLPEGYFILPGLIDLHCHGAGGGDFTSGSAADIKAAVELMFEVKVSDVNVVNVGGKNKRFGQRLGRRQDFKKAYVRLAPGQKIESLSGTEA